MWNLISLASLLFIVARSFYTTDDMYGTYDMYSTYDMEGTMDSCTGYYCETDTLDGCMDGYECMPDYGTYRGCYFCDDGTFPFTTNLYEGSTEAMDCLAYPGEYCDMYGDGCYDNQECDLSWLWLGCGFCEDEDMSTSMDINIGTTDDDSMEDIGTTDDSMEDMGTTDDSMEDMGTTDDSMDGMKTSDDSMDDMATTEMDMDGMATTDDGGIIAATEAGCTFSVIIATIFGAAVYGFM